MESLGCPPKFLSRITQLHKDQHDQVRLNSDLSKPFKPFLIVNGVKQGCVLAPNLFSILFNMMLKQAIEDLDDKDAVNIRYRFNGSLFNLRRLQAHTKTCEQLVQFADDAALIAYTERALQHLTFCFAKTAQLFGLEINLKKTEVFHQPALQKEYRLSHITIGQKMSPEWAIIAYPRKSCMTNYPLATVTKGH